MATIEEQLIEKGLEKGIEKGNERTRRVLLHFLTARFGAVAPEMRERVDRASGAELDTWAERAVAAERIEDVFDL